MIHGLFVFCSTQLEFMSLGNNPFLEFAVFSIVFRRMATWHLPVASNSDGSKENINMTSLDWKKKILDQIIMGGFWKVFLKLLFHFKPTV